MEVTCGHCKAKLNIPDEKIPKDHRVKVSCPKCKEKIILDARKTERVEPSTEKQADVHETEEPTLRTVESTTFQIPEEMAYSYDDYSDDDDLDFFEEETKLAIVMGSNTEHSEKIMKAVEELGYKYISTPDTRDALGKMRFHHFDLVFLSDGFDEQQLDRGPILSYLNHLSIAVRRQMFLVLMGDQFKTMDNMIAFAMSANAVVNIKDLDKLPAILKKAISDNERFYKVFMDTMVELGRG